MLENLLNVQCPASNLSSPDGCNGQALMAFYNADGLPNVSLRVFNDLDMQEKYDVNRFAYRKSEKEHNYHHPTLACTQKTVINSPPVLQAPANYRNQERQGKAQPSRLLLCRSQDQLSHFKPEIVGGIAIL
jgi:hypothetical protein